MIQDLSGSWSIKGTDKSESRVDSSVPLMHHDPDRSWITDPDPDHSKGTHPKYKRNLSYISLIDIMYTYNVNNPVEDRLTLML